MAEKETVMWICVDGERVTGANYNETLNYGWLRYDGEIPEGFYDNCCDYAYRNGELLYDPLPIPEPEEPPKNELEELIDILLGGEE